ncbi:MAG: hypothetical protein Q4F95_00560 [Oscillospiraceae bacterium]|nr:hypothetical protein [Oscillospiraceae bacterium]
MKNQRRKKVILSVVLLAAVVLIFKNQFLAIFKIIGLILIALIILCIVLRKKRIRIRR